MYAHTRVQNLTAGQISLSESDSRLLTPSCDCVGHLKSHSMNHLFCFAKLCCTGATSSTVPIPSEIAWQPSADYCIIWVFHEISSELLA